MPRVDNAYAFAVPYSDAVPWPHSYAAADAYSRAVPGAVADTYALPNAYAVPDAHAGDAGADPVSTVLPVPTASVPHNAGAGPHAASSRIP